MKITAQSASSMLYNGEVRDFPHAMELVMEQCCDEARNAPSCVDEYWTQADKDKLLCELDKMQTQARDALVIYNRIMEEAKRQAVAALTAAGLDGYSAALENDDYSELAI